jgi:uncharacterized membrane protein
MNDAALPAMPVPSDSLWSRLRTTPLRDALRGQLTGSLDVRRMIAAANLPEPIPSLIYVTIRRARLWRSARLEVARELIARFRANLDAGRAPEDVVKMFGDPTRVARSIRKEKLLRPAIARVELPQPLQELVYEVARRTRLWRSERVDVARELANHFRDGTDAGRTPEQLIKSFGNRREAAQLIRRAKLRSRPFVWRVWRRTWQAVGLLILLVLLTYIVLLIRLKTAHPTISRNYGLEMNAPARAVPEDDRAWPLYREAVLRLTAEPNFAAMSDRELSEDEVNFSVAAEKPTGKHWDMVVIWLDQNREALEFVRKASGRPRMGFVYGDPADRVWYDKLKLNPKVMDLERNELVAGLLLDHINEFHYLQNLLAADAHRAAALNDGATFIRDVETAVRMAGQIRDDMPFLVTEGVSFGLFSESLSLVDDLLMGRHELVDDAGLQRLAHSIAGYSGGGTIRARLLGQRLTFRDLYQRVYTDDGRGDGRLTAEGLRLLNNVKALSAGDADSAVAPVFSALIASRREMTRATDELFDRLENEINQPYWERSSSTVRDQIARWDRSPVDKIRYAPLRQMSSFAQYTAPLGDFITQRRDATLVALALELYHRRNGSWPKVLGELVPDLLPAVPPDRFTGGPLLYRVVEDRPLLYSAGPDKKDDGGKPIEGPALARLNPMFFMTMATAETKILTGDWILWPPPMTAKLDE